MMTKMNVFGKLLLCCMILVSCNLSSPKRNFEWTTEIAELTGKDLGAWLRRAPFSNELLQSREDSLVFDNAKQVFPFMGRYFNAVGELYASPENSANPIYQQETVLYQDPNWGDLFLNATLLHEPQEVFLNQHYSANGNMMFDGIGSSLDSYTATLAETSVFARSDAYKAGIYWAGTSEKYYLVGFYQKDKLILEAAIPLQGVDTLATLEQLNAISDTLGLDVEVWQEATLLQLRSLGTQETFWKDPFVGIYPEDRYMLNRVSLKLKDTPFLREQQASKGDYYFSYHTPSGKIELYTTLKDTDQDRKAFDKAHQDLAYYEPNEYRLYYTEEKSGSRLTGVAEIYVKKGQYLEIGFGYPADDQQAARYVHGVLEYVKVSHIL